MENVKDLLSKYSEDSPASPYAHMPRILDGYCLVDICDEVVDLLKEMPDVSDTRINRNEIQDIPSGVSEPRLKKGSPRILIACEMQTTITSLTQDAGRIIQSFTVFPRERLEVETVREWVNTVNRQDSRTVLDSSSDELEDRLSQEVLNEQGHTSAKVTAWEVSAKANFGAWGASAGVSGSKAVTDTSRSVQKRLSEQGRRAARSRKVEVKIHREIESREKSVNRVTRSFMNPNYDKPIDFIIHESVAHLVYATQVTSQYLIYQSKDHKKEIRSKVLSENSVGDFVKQVALDQSKITDLTNILKGALLLRRLPADPDGGAADYDPLAGVNLTQNSGGGQIRTAQPASVTAAEYSADYLPDEFVKFRSRLLNRDLPLRATGVVVDMDEIQLPTGDVIGRARVGMGDARGEMSSELHDLNLQKISNENTLQEARLGVTKYLQAKLDAAPTDVEAERWAQLLVDLLKKPHDDDGVAQEGESAQ